MKVNSEQLEALRRLVIDLNVQWQMFEDLYSHDEHFAIFNRTGPMFWDHLRAYQLDTIFSSISRFFDPAANSSQENLSLAAVLNFAEVAAIRPDLAQRLKKLVPVWKRGIKIWRHKKLSHSDKETALGVVALPDVPFLEIKELIVGITDFVREIDHRLNQTDVGYHVSISQWVPQVLSYLRAGIEKKDKDRTDFLAP